MGPKYALFGYLDPYTLNPYRTLIDPFKGTLMAPLEEPYLGTCTLRVTDLEGPEVSGPRAARRAGFDSGPCRGPKRGIPVSQRV